MSRNLLSSAVRHRRATTISSSGGGLRSSLQAAGKALSGVGSLYTHLVSSGLYQVACHCWGRAPVLAVQLVPWARYRYLSFLQWWEQSFSICYQGSLFYERSPIPMPHDEKWLKSTVLGDDDFHTV